MNSLPENPSPIGTTHAEEPADRKRSVWKGPVAIPADFKREAICAFEPICDIANSLHSVGITLLQHQYPSMTPGSCQTRETGRLIDAIFWGNGVHNDMLRIRRASDLKPDANDDFRKMLKYGPRLIVGVQDILAHTTVPHMREFDDCTKELPTRPWTELPHTSSDSREKGRKFAMMMALFVEAVIKFRLEAERMQENEETLDKDKIKLDPAIIEWAEHFLASPDCGTDLEEHGC